MVKAKEWNWAQVTDEYWNEPASDVYYLINRWKGKKYKNFLDLGCGLGRHSILFAQNGFNTHALDLSQYGIDTVNKNAKNLGLNIKTVLGDINNLPFEENTFDCLLSYNVLSHTDTEGIKKIIAEINRVIKSGGEFFITLCSKSDDGYSKKNYPKLDDNTIVKTEEPEVGVPHYYSDVNDVKRVLSDFELISIRQVEDIFKDVNSWHYFVHGRKK